MALFTKCILKDKNKIDGLRISVMSRHTLNDGVTKDERITEQKFDLHYPQLGPSLRLIGDYYKRGLSWEEFEKRFIEEMLNPVSATLLKEIAQKALNENITLMCIEETPHNCHRSLLAKQCKIFLPDLVVEYY